MISTGSGPPGDPDALAGSKDRHPTALGRHLDDYLAAVARELRVHGVITGSPRRGDPPHRLVGSIVLDCTALRLAARPLRDRSAGNGSSGGAIRPERPAPALATWDEDTGWCVGMHQLPAPSSPRYLHPDRLPVPTSVADFVVGLALGRRLGSTHPIAPPDPGRPRLYLVR